MLETILRSPEIETERKRELEKELLNLKITNRRKDLFIEKLKKCETL